MSRFNTLYHGAPNEAADVLEHSSPVAVNPQAIDELRIALINALRRIEQLDQDVQRLRSEVLS